jgi:hypothetical protein
MNRKTSDLSREELVQVVKDIRAALFGDDEPWGTEALAAIAAVLREAGLVSDHE